VRLAPDESWENITGNTDGGHEARRVDATSPEPPGTAWPRCATSRWTSALLDSSGLLTPILSFFAALALAAGQGDRAAPSEPSVHESPGRVRIWSWCWPGGRRRPWPTR